MFVCLKAKKRDSVGRCEMYSSHTTSIVFFWKHERASINTTGFHFLSYSICLSVCLRQSASSLFSVGRPAGLWSACRHARRHTLPPSRTCTHATAPTWNLSSWGCIMVASHNLSGESFPAEQISIDLPRRQSWPSLWQTLVKMPLIITCSLCKQHNGLSTCFSGVEDGSAVLELRVFRRALFVKVILSWILHDPASYCNIYRLGVSEPPEAKEVTMN